MKTLFTKTSIFALITFVFISFMSCEKINPTDVYSNDEVNITTKKAGGDPTFFAAGWALDKEYKLVGTYMRTHIKKWYIFHWFEPGCYGYTGNCLPDMFVDGSNAPVTSKDGEDNPTFEGNITFTASMQDYADLTYSDPLKKALSEGENSIKNFFKDNLCTKMEFSEEIKRDFANGDLTIKQFPEGIFIVKTNSTNFEDFPY